MAEKAVKTKTEVATLPDSEMASAPIIGEDTPVTIYIPRLAGQKDQPDVFVNWNGRRFLIQRGNSVTLPRGAARIIEDSEKNKEAAEMFYYNAASRAAEKANAAGV